MAQGEKKPENTFRVGYCSASVFRNNGNNDRTFLSASVQRRYRDGDGWKSSSSFGLGELPQAIRVMQLAQQYIEREEAEIQSN